MDTKMQIGCVIMASGESKRFGSNKLMITLHKKTLMQTIIDTAMETGFSKLVVVTRTEAVRELCQQQNIRVIYHDYPYRNDTVRLGIQQMEDMDGCMFCPCDQPYLQATSLKRMIEQFGKTKQGIVRLEYDGRVGMPILFGKEYFKELTQLPAKSGGSYVVDKHLSRVSYISAGDAIELMDIDTQKDYEELKEK